MLRSIFAGLFAIVLTLGLGISSVSAKTVEVKLERMLECLHLNQVQ